MIAESIAPGHVKSEDEHRRDICIVGRWIHARNFVAATDGNISVRLDSSRILTSPTAISKGMMAPDDLVVTDLKGKRISGRRPPSSELAMHLLIYRRRPDVLCRVPRASAHRHRVRGRGAPAQQSHRQRSGVVARMHSRGALRHSGHAGIERARSSRWCKITTLLLMANHGVVTYGAGPADRIFPHGDGGAFRAGFAGHGDTWQTSLAFWPRCGKIARGTRPLRLGHRVTGRPAVPGDFETEAAARVSFTRDELEALIEEGNAKKRSKSTARAGSVY